MITVIDTVSTIWMMGGRGVSLNGGFDKKRGNCRSGHVGKRRGGDGSRGAKRNGFSAAGAFLTPSPGSTV